MEKKCILYDWFRFTDFSKRFENYVAVELKIMSLKKMKHFIINLKAASLPEPGTLLSVLYSSRINKSDDCSHVYPACLGPTMNTMIDSNFYKS